MDTKEYYNDMMARLEELFYHELSDCAAWKTEFVGVDFIRSREIAGGTREEVIESCCREIIGAGLAKEISYAIAGKDILLYLKIRGCQHISKEVQLRQRNILIYNCPPVNMIMDQLIEKLNFETTYIADIGVDETAGECTLKVAIYETPEKIGCVSDWTDECRTIDENGSWKTIAG
ncbi:MAG: hypothetical protein GY866_00480 [Proteobacteria bacterium]|nr:hypothetical protein [Pseudomonadota bacterium]